MSYTEWDHLFSTEGLQKSKEPASIDFDNPRFWLTPARNESATLGEKLQSEAFFEQLAPTGQLRKLAPITIENVPTFDAPRASAELAKLASTLGKAWDSKKHRQKIQAMVDKLKSAPALATVKDDPQWETLVTHCLDYVCAQIQAEAV